MNHNLYLVEYYNLAGSIWFAWVGAASADDAEAKLANRITDSRGAPIRFCERIQVTQHAVVSPLALSGLTPKFVDVGQKFLP